MKLLNKENIRIKYLKDPYNVNMTTNQSEILKQLNLFNIEIDNINKINTFLGNIVIVLKYKHNSLILYYRRYYGKK